MSASEKKTIKVSTLIKSPVKKVWELWTGVQHNLHWNSGSPDWQTTRAENDLRMGGKFLFHMEAKDGSAGFDFVGEYNFVLLHKFIGYNIADGRNVSVIFASKGDETEIIESFEAEEVNSLELQKTGWQNVLENFKRYAEAGSDHDVLHFEIVINNSPEKVYNTLIDENKYKEWTSVFNPSSHFNGSWNKGSKIFFVGTDADGNKSGMTSRIRENIPGRYISIEHLGIIRNNEEITSGPEVDVWEGALENYTFTPVKGNTLLSVDLDSNKEFGSYFSETFPKALEKLKSICE